MRVILIRWPRDVIFFDIVTNAMIHYKFAIKKIFPFLFICFFLFVNIIVLFNFKFSNHKYISWDCFGGLQMQNNHYFAFSRAPKNTKFTYIKVRCVCASIIEVARGSVCIGSSLAGSNDCFSLDAAGLRKG